MDFQFTKEEEAFREEVRDWLQKEIPQRWIELDPVTGIEETDESWAISRQFQRKLAHKGWLAPLFPKEYGGIGASHMESLILSEEIAYYRAPVGLEVEISAKWVAPAIMLYGTEEDKRKYVGGVAKGDIIFCLGYSEPNAGSDLASLQTRAVEDGDEYVVNGQKIWTSLGHYADYCFLAARTDPDAPKHKGLSMFIVDMKTPGITVRPLINILNYHSFNEVFFDDVRIPKQNLIGEKNRGWYQLAVALDFERSGISVPASHRRTIEELVEYAKQTGRNKDPVVRHKLAEIAIENEVCRMLCYRVAWMQSKGLIPNYEASMSMVFGNELGRRLVNIGMQIMGPCGQLAQDSKWAPLKGRIMREYLASVAAGIGAGTSEIQRNIIAMRGLGLPRGL